MYQKTAVVLIAIAICMFPVAAFAEPTVSGPTGLIVNPTAETAPVDHMWVAINFIDLDTIILPDQSVLGGTAWTGLLTGGITKEFEMGLGFIMQEDSDNGILLHAKYQILPDNEDEWYPALAVGGTLSDYSGDRTSSVYMVLGKFFWVADKGYYGGGIHGGLEYVNPKARDWELQYFLGADLSFTEQIIGIVEFSQEEGGFGDGFTYGVRYFFNDTTTAQAGFIDGDLTIGGAYIF
jgi:hypothetical protein